MSVRRPVSAQPERLTRMVTVPAALVAGGTLGPALGAGTGPGVTGPVVTVVPATVPATNLEGQLLRDTLKFDLSEVETLNVKRFRLSHLL